MGVGTSAGIGIGGEFLASPNGQTYQMGVVIAPSIWAGGTGGYGVSFGGKENP